MIMLSCYCGGHTAEMINVLTVLQKDMFFFPRINVVSATGNMSLRKARVSEDNMVDRIQEAHLPRHINLQWNILKFKSSFLERMQRVKLNWISDSHLRQS